MQIMSLPAAIICAVAYADQFDWAITAEEIHRYLPEYRVRQAVIEELLAKDRYVRERLQYNPPFWFLSDRDSLDVLRREREAHAAHLWPLARRYGHILASLPYVRMVAVTGSLAVNNAMSSHDDIDFFIVGEAERVWLARGMTVLVVRAARRLGADLCPNYVISESALELDPRNLFIAHELAQLFPLYGPDAYRSLLKGNSWAVTYLPNAFDLRMSIRQLEVVPRSAQRVLEIALGSGLGDGIESWEQGRKIPRLIREAEARDAEGAMFTPDVCKGHLDDVMAAVLARFERRLAALGL